MRTLNISACNAGHELISHPSLRSQLQYDLMIFNPTMIMQLAMIQLFQKRLVKVLLHLACCMLHTILPVRWRTGNTDWLKSDVSVNAYGCQTTLIKLLFNNLHDYQKRWRRKGKTKTRVLKKP